VLQCPLGHGVPTKMVQISLFVFGCVYVCVCTCVHVRVCTRVFVGERVRVNLCMATL
jgi:hypothetical protein